MIFLNLFSKIKLYKCRHHTSFYLDCFRILLILTKLENVVQVIMKFRLFCNILTKNYSKYRHFIYNNNNNNCYVKTYLKTCFITISFI